AELTVGHYRTPAGRNVDGRGITPDLVVEERAVALLPADYGVFCLVFLLLGAPGAFRAGYAALAVVHTLFLALFLGKWFRELKALRGG
ncbi:hypothetical protein ABTX86_35175, partial [Streptomyces anulatus]